jgi:hypothetical protein
VALARQQWRNRQPGAPVGEPASTSPAPLEPGEIKIEAAIMDRGNVLAQQGGTSRHRHLPPVPPLRRVHPPLGQALRGFSERRSVGYRERAFRAGDGYPRLGQVRRGETYRVTGRDEAGDWLQITFEGDPGWVTSDLVSVNGTIDNVARVEVEPPPAPVAQAAPAAQPAAAPAAAAKSSASYPPAGGYFGYGTQAQVYGGADLGYVSSATRNMGFNWVKYQVPWKDFEGSKGAYGWGGMDASLIA